MKFFVLIFLLCELAFSQIYKLNLEFDSFVNDENFVFRSGERTITCRYDDIRIINLAIKPQCMKIQADIRKYYINHKKSIENFMEKGRIYYVVVKKEILNENGKKVYLCDTYYKKYKTQYGLLAQGWAMPSAKQPPKDLLAKYNTAKRKGRGMFAQKHNELKECLFYGTPMKSQMKKPIAKDEFYIYYD